MINLSSFIAYHASRTPAAPALSYDAEQVSYSEFYRRVVHLAGWLARFKLQPGDVVAVLMKNSPAFLEIAFAVSHIGAVFLPINFRLAAAEVEYIVDHSGAKVLFVDEELIAAGGWHMSAIVLDRAAQRSTIALSLSCEPAPMVPRQPGDLFRLMYTSGTTDHPKGVMHSYENFYWKSLAHVAVLRLDSSTRLLVAGPLYHVGAFDLPGIAVLWQGGMLAVQREFEPAKILSRIAIERLNGAWLAPVMMSTLLAQQERDRCDVSSLRWVVGGGERTPESRIRQFSRYFECGRYIDAYGLTESSSGDSFMEKGRELEKIGSTGRSVPHLDISIRDDAGDAVSAATTGEVCLRGPKIFKAYWRDPEKTAAAFFSGNWFRTGDVGYLDSDGFLYLTDRKKDMIISGGENIASSEVERVIQMLPCVAEVAVIGIPDLRWGESPAAIIVPAPDQSIDLETLKRHCCAHLAGFKTPKTLILRASLPRNPSGKVLKRQLREELSHLTP